MIKTLPVLRISLPTPWPALGDVHAYLVREDPVTLIDAGLNDRPSREALLAGLQEAGVELRDIRRLLLTHAHTDHYGQAAWLQEATGAEVWMHPDEAAKVTVPDWWLRGRDRALVEAGAPAESLRLMEEAWRRGRHLELPLTGWLPLEDGQQFAFETGSLTAVHLPGHALGHTAFWDQESGLLMGGDLLLEGVTPNPIMEPLPEGHPAAVPHAPGRALTLGQFLDSVERVSQMPVHRVFPGHGPVIGDHVAVARHYQAKHERRLDSLQQRIRQRATAYEITRELFPRVREMDIFLAVSEVLAHLDLLVARGRAAVEPGDGGSALYRAI